MMTGRYAAPYTALAQRLALAMLLFLGALAVALPQQVLTQRPTSKTTLITLGTQGGPIQNKHRAQPANVLIVNNQPYLVDAGNGVAHQLTLAGVALGRINQIFVTHNHDDHSADLGTVMGLAWSLGRSAPTTVYGPKGVREMINAFFKSFSVSRDLRRSDFPDFYRAMPEELFRVHEIEGQGTIYRDENIQVEAIENCHFHFASGAPAGEAKSHAFRFKSADKTIVFSGDTGTCESMVDFARGADILVHEVVNLDLYAAVLQTRPFSPEQRQNVLRHMKEDHTTPDEIGKLAARARVGMVILSHIIPGGDDDPDSAYSEGVTRNYAGNVVVAKDLMRF
jgi:ribonuclease BN (tRNA processing enzyme)